MLIQALAAGSSWVVFLYIPAISASMLLSSETEVTVSYGLVWSTNETLKLIKTF